MRNQTRSPQMRTRQARRIKAQTRRRSTWRPIQTTQRNTHPLLLPAISRARLRRTRGMALTSRPTRVQMIRVTANSRMPTLLSRLRPCPTTNSHILPATTISGHPATGPGRPRAISGCPAPGLRLPTRAHFGRQATGASITTATAFTAATGADMSATMAASTTVLGI